MWLYLGSWARKMKCQGLRMLLEGIDTWVFILTFHVVVLTKALYFFSISHFSTLGFLVLSYFSLLRPYRLSSSKFDAFFVWVLLMFFFARVLRASCVVISILSYLLWFLGMSSSSQFKSNHFRSLLWKKITLVGDSCNAESSFPPSEYETYLSEPLSTASPLVSSSRVESLLRRRKITRN